ncbi:LPXTG cell wall anchor domain-containing protein [Lactococcus lactis]|uniref:LPXTG cell wall anchor domain-containing protein n=1 Tax=Lactococcus lactis TaxID=1358 RepID=UPI0027EEB830|nr:LPXTG cell wall anchor domain-containing protein [Lactococcus lactis]MDQ7173645.1 LPXTG cell wall anchor domain-containing protein [Lactococcus lactis]
MKDQDQTLTVEKVKKPVTPPSSTTPSSSKPTTPSTTPTPIPKVSLPTTGSETGDVIAYGGAVAMLVALGIGGFTHYMKKKKSTEEG